MIKVTLGQLVTADQALGRLTAERLPIKVSYALGKLAKAIAAEVECFHKERNAAVTMFGAERPTTEPEKANGHGGTIMAVLPEHHAAFVARVNELAALSVELPGEPISLAALGEIQISTADLLALEPLVAD